MPYKVKKQKCKQSDGKSGKYVVQKKKSGKWKKASCHASEKKADSAKRARGMHEESESFKSIRLLIRTIIKESNISDRTSYLPDFFYEPLERAISDSRFWTHENTPDDSDMISVGGDWHNQTPAAEILGDVIQNFLSSHGITITIAVRSAEPDFNTNLSLPVGPDHRLYPNRIVVGGAQGVSDRGRFVMYLNMLPVSDDFNTRDVDSDTVSKLIGNIVRHEYIHARQIEKRKKSQKVSRQFAKDQYEKEGEIPDSEDREKYLGSNIEIDAYAHEFAESLLQKYGKEKSLDILRGKIPHGSVDLPDQFKEYLENIPGKQASQKLMKKVYGQIMSLTGRGIYETVKGSYPEDSYQKANKKNLHLDKPTSHGGWPEGEYDPPVNDQISSWLKSMYLIEKRSKWL
tara:strand:+ start:8605 stop:9807 length:1203 start_codon:yes stop_codon:yes gene_type:complete